MNHNDYISLHQVIDNIYMNPLMENCPLDFMINKVIELIGVVSVPSLFDHKTATIDIEKHRAELPCDFYEMEGVVLEDGSIGHEHHKPDIKHIDETIKLKRDAFETAVTAGNSELVYQLQHEIEDLERLRRSIKDDVSIGYKNRVFKAFVYSTDTFGPYDKGSASDPTYSIKGNVIYTSFETCTIKIAYRAFAIDKEGYPLIVNNYSFIRAVEAYVTLGWYKILFAQSKLNQNVVQMQQNDYNWAIGNAVSSLHMPTYDQVEQLSRLLNNLLPSEAAHANTFNGIGHNNQLRRH